MASGKSRTPFIISIATTSSDIVTERSINQIIMKNHFSSSLFGFIVLIGKHTISKQIDRNYWIIYFVLIPLIASNILAGNVAGETNLMLQGSSFIIKPLAETNFTCPTSECFFHIPNTCGADYYVCVLGSPYVSV